MKRIVTIVFITILSFFILGGGITYLVFGVVPFGTTQDSASTLSMVPTATEWEQGRHTLRSLFEEELYGPVPQEAVRWNTTHTLLYPENALEGVHYELWTLYAPGREEPFLHAVALIPESDTPLPYVVASSFCPNHVKFPSSPIPPPSSFPSFCEQMNDGSIAALIFGPYVATYPFEEFAKRKIALISIYLGEAFADEKAVADNARTRFEYLTGSGVEGALAAWAWTYHEVARVAAEDSRFDATRGALYGHSRDGKAALLAGAFFDDIDLVIAHQSGRGGASPLHHTEGESFSAMYTAYPHWFAATPYTSGKLPFSINQHKLIALMAPRPLLLTGAWLDKWGDPRGARDAAREASTIYSLYGVGSETVSLYSFLPEQRLAFFMRPWFHGVQKEDWDAFFEFLEVHF